MLITLRSRDGKPWLDVYSATEVAAAAGVPPAVVEAHIARADIATIDGELVTFEHAAAAVIAIRSGELRRPDEGSPSRVLGETLSRRAARRPSRRLPAVMSVALHALAVATVVLLAGTGLTTASDSMGLGPTMSLTHLLFVATPGPAGGGGGGGLQQPAPPPKAERQGQRALSSPLPERIAPRQIRAALDPVPPPLEHESLPHIFAPLVPSPSERRDVRGLLVDGQGDDPAPSSQGSGTDGGVGSGSGTGIGSGRGSGVGPGSGGGVGGGPYRGGSGISPPRLLREIRPDYTEEARQRGVEGEVQLEVVVRTDGTVGDVRVTRRLGFGLDQQAVAALRQWRFAPAERDGTPVEVLVEVAVEFKLR